MKLSSDQQDINKKKYLQFLGPSLKGFIHGHHLIPYFSQDINSPKLVQKPQTGWLKQHSLFLTVMKVRNLRTAISRSAFSLDPLPCLQMITFFHLHLAFFSCVHIWYLQLKLPFTEKPVRLEQDLPIGPDLTLITLLKTLSLNTDIT